MVSKAEKLTSLLRRVNNGEDPSKIREENFDFLRGLALTDVALAQGNLLNSGLTVSELTQMVPIYASKGLIADQVSVLRCKVKDNHVIRSLLAEHEFVLGYIADLQRLSMIVLQMSELKDTSSEYRKLIYIADHMRNFKRHMDFEDDVLFPKLTKNGFPNFFDQIKSDHLCIKIALNDLYVLIEEFDKYKLRDFKSKLMALAKYLYPVIKEHIFVENNIVYPISVDTFRDNILWSQIKELRDSMGYAMF